MTLTNDAGAATRVAFAIVVSIGLAAAGDASDGGRQMASGVGAASTMTVGTPVETHDAALASALLRLVAARTAENLAAVADRYYQLGIRDTAMEYYAEAIVRNPRSVWALDGTARIWRDWGQMGQALGSAYRAIYFAPGSAAAWNTLGTILQALDEHSASADAYRRAISLDEAAVYARSNLCYLAFVAAEADRAVAECAAALRVDGGFAPALNNLALVYAAVGDTPRAFEVFAAAAGGEAVAHYNLGIVLLAERRYDEAVRAFEGAYRLDPSFDRAHARARDARRQALAARGNTHGRR
jgi:tetratricopeptide (TPR) repeat protein